MKNSVPRLKLGDVLAVYEPIHVLGTTFTLSLAFFESSVWPRIKTNRLSNFLIISDRIGLSRAYQEAPALKLAGREYVATAAPTRRTFHPKVWLLIEERRALLLVGSGNLTQAGFMENLELFEAIEMGPETKCSAKLREDVQEFLKGLRSLWPVQDLSDELPALRALDQILKAFADLPNEISESKECKRRLFHSFQGKFTELLPQLEERQTLSVASPYFGGSERGLVRLKASLKAKRVAVYPAVHRDDGVDFNVMQKNSLEGFEFHRMKVEGDRFAHLKLISATGVQGKDWIFSGSINCTDAALSAENIEAGLWRPLDKKTIQAYFEKDQAPLPSKRTELANVNSDSVSGSIHFSAVFNGSSLKLYPAITQNPVKDVSITVSTSSREFNAHFGRAFDDQGSLNLGLNSFGKPLHFSGSAVVSVSAKSNDGNHVEGKAFVDDSTLLYIDASTRRALQYALMMVESDGIDESLDCLDDLLDSLDGLEDFALPLDESEDGSAKAQPSMKEQSALPPIWPPMVLPSNISAKSGANVLGSIHFAQRILSALFGYDSVPTASENVHELALESEQDQVASLVKSKKADHNWSFIENRFECLCERLRELEPDQTSSKNLWAMGATFFLVTLIARRAYRQPATTLTKILREFLRSIFSPRPQDSFSRQAHTRYSTRVFPALAADLRDNFKSIPSEEFKAILISAFAFLLADSRSKRTKFILIPEFMLLKSLVERVGSKKFFDTDRATVVYKRYFSGADSSVSQAAFISELSNIENLSWADHPSFRDLAVLLSKEPIPKEKISPHLQPHLGKFLKIRARADAVIALEPGSTICDVKGCSRRYQVTPEKRFLDVGLAIICSGCGTLLVPADLLKGFKEQGKT